MRFIFIWIIGLVVAVYPDLTTDTIKSSFSIQSMGRGGADVAEPYGADALYSNPAGLVQVGGGYHYNNLDSSEVNSDFKRSNVFHRRSFGLGIWKNEKDGNFTEITSIGLAKRNRNGVDWGLTYKSIYDVQDDQKLTYWSSNLGVIVHMNEMIDVGFFGKDILYQKDSGISPSFESGVLIKNKDASFKLYSDYVSEKYIDDYSDQYVRIGLDYMLTPEFTVRLGGDQLYYTSGVSFNIAFFSVDYAVQMPKDSTQESVYAIGFKLGRSKNLQQFRRKYALFKPKSLAYVEIDGRLTSGYSSISLLGGRKIGSNDLIQLIHEANKDPDCKGFFIRMKSLDSDLSHVSLIQELRMELQKSKDLGKHVVVYLDGWASMPSYYLASVADYIVMPPMGTIHQLGIQYEVIKFDQLMERFGVAFNAVHSGKFKLSTSPLSESLSKSQKETISSTIENVLLTIKNDIKTSRSDQWLTIKPYFDGRLITAEEALEVGLIDQIGFWSDMPKIIKDELSINRDVVLTSIDSFSDQHLYDHIWSPFNKIAVVEINGEINQGKNKQDFLFGGIKTGSDETAHIFEQLAKDPFLKGVILRINSPGGSMVASDQILHSINEFKRITKKPVFASMGTYAASGGYYIAMGTDRVFANPASITGSIGVFSGVLNFHELQKEWGIESTSLSTGKYMDAFSPHQSFSDEKRSMITQHQYKVYEYFKFKVQDSRQLTDSEVSAVAQGQFMSGNQAQELGLVDDIGNYTDVISEMEKKTGISSSRVVVYGRPKTPTSFDFFRFLFDQ